MNIPGGGSLYIIMISLSTKAKQPDYHSSQMIDHYKKKQYKTTRSVNQGKGQLRRKIKSCKNFKATDCLRFKETNAKLTV